MHCQGMQHSARQNTPVHAKSDVWQDQGTEWTAIVLQCTGPEIKHNTSVVKSAVLHNSVCRCLFVGRKSLKRFHNIVVNDLTLM
jgi:hypothetical protein